MDMLSIENKDFWRNDGYEEQYQFLKCLGYRAVAVDYITVKYKDDENFSTSFQMRHVVDSLGNRGFMCFVDKEMLYWDNIHRKGSTQNVYETVKIMGISLQQEMLRRSWIKLNRA